MSTTAPITYNSPAHINSNIKFQPPFRWQWHLPSSSIIIQNLEIWNLPCTFKRVPYTFRARTCWGPITACSYNYWLRAHYLIHGIITNKWISLLDNTNDKQSNISDKSTQGMMEKYLIHLIPWRRQSLHTWPNLKYH